MDLFSRESLRADSSTPMTDSEEKLDLLTTRVSNNYRYRAIVMLWQFMSIACVVGYAVKYFYTGVSFLGTEPMIVLFIASGLLLQLAYSLFIQPCYQKDISALEQLKNK